jgi:excisionase family DNA binding protein
MNTHGGDYDPWDAPARGPSAVSHAFRERYSEQTVRRRSPWQTGDAWLSPRQVAQRFGVGTSAIYGAVKRGELPAIRLGRHIRIPL